MGNRILVVDDDAMNLKMAEFILKQKNYSVTCVNSGEKALDELTKGTTDLMLLDIEMPIMNGIETLKKIRNNPATAELPVMFLTASVDVADIADAGKLGALDYIKKPFMPADLQARVEKVLGA